MPLSFQPIIRAIKNRDYCLPMPKLKSFDYFSFLFDVNMYIFYRTRTNEKKIEQVEFISNSIGKNQKGKSISKTSVGDYSMIDGQKQKIQALNANIGVNKNCIAIKSDASIANEPLVIARRPKSSQAGIMHSALLRSGNKPQGMRKYRKASKGNETANVKLESNINEEFKTSLQKYANSIGITNGIDFTVRNTKVQPKNAAFLKHFVKKNEDEVKLASKTFTDNFNIRRKAYKDVSVTFYR